MGARFPEFREELFIERRAQITDAFRAARAALCAEHSLDHLHVMRAPQNQLLVVRDQTFGELVFFVKLLEVREDFKGSAHALAVSGARIVGVVMNR